MVDLRQDLQQRLERAQSEIGRQGLGALVAYSSGQHNMLRMDQVWYLADFRCMGPSVLVVPASGRTTLLVTPVWDAERAREAAGVHDVKGVQPSELAQAIKTAVAQTSGAVALAGRDSMPMGFAEELGLDAFKDGEKLVPSLADTRTPAELEQVAIAANIADKGFEALCETAQVGMREYELAAEMEAAMQAAGSEDNFGLLGAGAHNIAIRPPTDRRLEAGDLIVGEITPCYQGHFAQLCRTFILGEPNDVQKQKFDMLVGPSKGVLKPPSPACPARASPKPSMASSAPPDTANIAVQPYMRTRGHGLGFGGIVPYDVTEEPARP